MNVNLTPELERIVENKARASGYNSVSDVIMEALLLMIERDRFKTLQKEEMRKKIEEGLESQRLGRLVDGDAVFDRLEAELDERERLQSP